MAEHSPLHELTSQAGATFVEQAGYSMPQHYGDPLAEYPNVYHAFSRDSISEAARRRIRLRS